MSITIDPKGVWRTNKLRLLQMVILKKATTIEEESAHMLDFNITALSSV